MEAIQGQMQLYNSVAGPFPASTFVSFSTPPGTPDQMRAGGGTRDRGGNKINLEDP